jgi:hypothetical protein
MMIERNQHILSASYPLAAPPTGASFGSRSKIFAGYFLKHEANSRFKIDRHFCGRLIKEPSAPAPGTQIPEFRIKFRININGLTVLDSLDSLLILRRRSNLKLGPLPNQKTVRVTIMLPEPLKEELDAYAREHSRLYGPVETAALIPHMLQAFLLRIAAGAAAGNRRARASRSTAKPHSAHANTSDRMR